MNQPSSNARVRRLVLLASGLIDMLLGAGLVLAFAGVLPVDLAAFGVPRALVGGVGALFFLSGTAVAVYQLTKPVPPDD